MTTTGSSITPAQNPKRLPSTEQLLVTGGDDRITPDPRTGLNKYGCQPRPDPQLLALGSSTASVISEEGFIAADQLRHKLIRLMDSEPETVIYARELQRIRTELLGLCDLNESPDTDIIFAPSGTDLHLIAAQYACEHAAKPTLAIMVEAAETGSSVAAALSGRHVSTEGSVHGAHKIHLANIRIRLDDGNPRPLSEIDAEVTALAEAAASQDQHVLLILTDQSKTGLIAPSPVCAATLKQRFPHALDILVDACQFRIAPATLRAYLEQDFMVALTGSKFIGGPTFSAALLIPPGTSKRLQSVPVPAALSGNSTRADWPASWASATALRDSANFGLLLRWEAALQTLRAFRALANSDIARFLSAFANAIQQRIASDPCFEALPVLPLDRRPLVQPDNWDNLPTIFPFMLLHTDNPIRHQRFSRDETRHVYQWMQQDLSRQPGFDLTSTRISALRCQLGQPVACGKRQNTPVSALRLCVSARMIIDATSGRGTATIIEQALAALDKAAFLTRCSPLTFQKQP